MKVGFIHAKDGPGPERSRRTPSEAEGEGGPGGGISFRLLAPGDGACCGAAHVGRVAAAPGGASACRPADAPGKSRQSRAGPPLIVVDASAILEVLLNTPAAPRVADRLFVTGETLHAPHLIDLEVAQVLRRYAIGRDLDTRRGRQALENLLRLPLTRYPHHVFLPRIWELRHNVTAYDAAYVTLAEALAAPLLTRDAALAAASGHHARIELV